MQGMINLSPFTKHDFLLSSWQADSQFARKCLSHMQTGLSLQIVFQICDNMFCLFDLILYFPVNNFSVMSGWVFLGWTSTKQGFMCLAQGHNAVTPVRLEPATSRSRDKHSTTEPATALHSVIIWDNYLLQWGDIHRGCKAEANINFYSG